MALETATYIGDLVGTNPVGATDKVKFGDDHLRMIKQTLQATFPNLVGRSWRLQAKAAGYTVVANDNMTVFNCTAGLTLALTAAATLGNGHLFVVIANGGTVTIDPDAAETIGGAATLSVATEEVALVMCNGTTFFAAKMPWTTATQVEAEAGTGTSGRLWTPQRIAQAIVALAPPVTTLGLTDGGIKYSSFSALSGYKYDCDNTTAGTIWLPASPSAKDIIALGIASATWSSTVNPNGNKINGSTDARVFPGRMLHTLMFTGTTEGWI